MEKARPTDLRVGAAEDPTPGDTSQTPDPREPADRIPSEPPDANSGSSPVSLLAAPPPWVRGGARPVRMGSAVVTATYRSRGCEGTRWECAFVRIGNDGLAWHWDPDTMVEEDGLDPQLYGDWRTDVRPGGRHRFRIVLAPGVAARTARPFRRSGFVLESADGMATLRGYGKVYDFISTEVETPTLE